MQKNIKKLPIITFLFIFFASNLSIEASQENDTNCPLIISCVCGTAIGAIIMNCINQENECREVSRIKKKHSEFKANSFKYIHKLENTNSSLNKEIDERNEQLQELKKRKNKKTVLFFDHQENKKNN